VHDSCSKRTFEASTTDVSLRACIQSLIPISSPFSSLPRLGVLLTAEFILISRQPNRRSDYYPGTAIGNLSSKILSSPHHTAPHHTMPPTYLHTTHHTNHTNTSERSRNVGQGSRPVRYALVRSCRGQLVGSHYLAPILNHGTAQGTTVAPVVSLSGFNSLAYLHFSLTSKV
jgi:hypothetical protein